MSEQLDKATIAAWARRQRAAQGLPPKIQDPAVLARLVTLAFAGVDDDAGPAVEGG